MRYINFQNKGLIRKIIYIAIISYVFFGNAMTFNIGNRLPVKLAEVFSVFVLAAFVVIFLNYALRIPKKERKKAKWVFVWILVGFFSAVINTFIYGFQAFDLLYGLLYLIRVVHIFLYCWVLAYFAKCIRMPARKIANCIIYCFVGVCLVGFFQLVFFPVAADWYQVFYKIGAYWPDPDPHIGRLISTYFDPNYLASILVIPIAIIVARLIRGKRIFRNLLFLGLFVATTLLTKSRSGIIGLGIVTLVAIVYYCYWKRNPLLFVGIVICATPIAIYLLFFSNITVFERIRTFASDDSASHRFDSWASSLETILKNPIIGIGYNMYGAYAEMVYGEVAVTGGYGTDSSVLFIFITTGLVGGIAFIVGMVLIFKHKSHTVYDVAFKMIILASLVVCFFNNLLFNVLWLFPVALLGLAKPSFNAPMSVRKKIFARRRAI